MEKDNKKFIIPYKRYTEIRDADWQQWLSCRTKNDRYPVSWDSGHSLLVQNWRRCPHV